MNEARKLHKTRFQAVDDEYLWTACIGDCGNSGDLNYCLQYVSEAISCEVEYYGSLLGMDSKSFDISYNEKIKEIRHKCLKDGSASGNIWWICHDSLMEE